MSQQREHTRFDYETDIEIQYNGTTQRGSTVNISQGGALIRTSPAPAFNTSIKIFMNLPGVKERCEIKCIARWANEDEVGVQFEMLRPIEVWAINRMRRT